MEVTLSKQDDIDIVVISGEIDAKNASEVHSTVEPLLQKKSSILMDMSDLVYMSSAGLRLMLLIYRGVTGNDGKMVLVGLSENLTDMMSATGFLDYFTVTDSREAAMETLKADS